MTPEHAKARRGRVTGSRIGAIAGSNPYQSADDVMREMVREHFSAEPEFVGNAATRWGNEHEADALAWFENETGAMCMPGEFRKAEDWAGSAPDAFADGEPVEAKCPQFFREMRPHEYDQCQWHMYVCLEDLCHFVVWTPQMQSATKVKRESPRIKELAALGRAHWEEFRRIIADPDLTAPYLQDRVREREDSEWRDAADQYLLVKQAADDAAKALASAKQRLIDLSDAQTQRGNGVTVSRVKARVTYDYRKAAIDAELDLGGYQKTGEPSWRVLID